LSTEIYYFSGSGNSLAVAKDIAGKIDGRLVSIPAMMERECIKPDAEALGIVFPVYHGDMPLDCLQIYQKTGSTGT
jgi:flavodoxin